jgi:two-component system OmpR family response regulator
MITDVQNGLGTGQYMVPAICLVPAAGAREPGAPCDATDRRPARVDSVIVARRLLLVEDDPRVGRFIAQGLRGEGYDVDWAMTAEDGLTQTSTRSFDVVLLDHMLPDRSGIEVAQTLRSRGNQVPILMLTARDAPEDRQAAFAAGATDFMGKPFRFDELLERIQTLLAG